MAKKSTQPSIRERLGGRRDALFGVSNDLPRVIEIEISKLRPNPDQPRHIFDKKSLRELANSIEKHGLLNPITVKKDDEGDGFIIVAGERRTRAFQLLERETIAAIRTEGSPDEISIIENIQREDLSPIEEAEALARLKERHGYTHSDLAGVVGKARNTITELLGLNSLPQSIKDECRTSDIASKSVLIELSRVKDEPRRLKLWEEVKLGRTTVRATRAKKAGDSQRGSKSSADKLLAAGNSFVRKLEALSSEIEVGDNLHDQLRDIQTKINSLIPHAPTNEVPESHDEVIQA